MVTCKQTGVEFLCKLIPDGAPNSAVHPGPLEKLVDWQAWRMRKSSLYKMNYPALAHWTAQIPLEITCDWNTYTAFSREECRVVFYPRKAAEVTQWPREDVRRPVKMESILTSPGRHTKKTGTPGQVTNIGSNEYMYHNLKIPRTEKGQLSLVTMHSNLTTKCNNNPKNNFYCHPTSQSPTSKQSLQTNKGWNSEMTLRTSVASAAALSWWQAATLGWFTQTTREKNNQQHQNINSNALIEKVTLSVTKRTDAHEHLPPEATRRTITTANNKPRHWARAGPETCANRIGSLLSSPAPCMQAQGAQSPLTIPGNKLIFLKHRNIEDGRVCFLRRFKRAFAALPRHGCRRVYKKWPLPAGCRWPCAGF